MKKTEYFINKAENEAFNATIEKVIDGYNEHETMVIHGLISDYSKLVALWTYSTAYEVLQVADMQVQYNKILEKGKKKDKGISREDTETLQNLSNEIKKIKQGLGIDSKSLASKGDGSISEAFADVVSRGKFDKRRFVCKAVLGAVLKETSDEVDAFKHLDDRGVDEYLKSASALN